MNHRIPAALLALTVTACAGTPDPRTITQEVLVPVPVSCVPDRAEFDAAPEYRVTLADIAAIAPGPRLAIVLWAALLEREARLQAVEPVVAACREVAE